MQTNMVEEGYLVGKLISEIAETKLDGQARTLEIFATPGTSAVNDRNNGFSNAVRDFGNIHLWLLRRRIVRWPNPNRL